MESPARRTYFLIVAIFLRGLVSFGFAQGSDIAAVAPPTPSTERSRIGLALSGGGALGLTEIGVIKWMEENNITVDRIDGTSMGGSLGLSEIVAIKWMKENHIPVDRIAGTSMGSIIGSMYATGMTPAEIETFAEKIDWDEAFLPEPVYTQISFRRKQDRRDFLIKAPLGLKHCLRGPNGFNSGQGVGLLL